MPADLWGPDGQPWTVETLYAKQKADREALQRGRNTGANQIQEGGLVLPTADKSAAMQVYEKAFAERAALRAEQQQAKLAAQQPKTPTKPAVPGSQPPPKPLPSTTPRNLMDVVLSERRETARRLEESTGYAWKVKDNGQIVPAV